MVLSLFYFLKKRTPQYIFFEKRYIKAFKKYNLPYSIQNLKKSFIFNFQTLNTHNKGEFDKK